MTPADQHRYSAAGPRPSLGYGQVKPERPLLARLSRYSIILTFSLVLVGVAAGVGLSRWQPVDEAVKEATLQWIGLPGDIFIRTLRAVTLPLVFANVTVAIVEMMNHGRVRQIGWSTVWLYMGTTVLATGFGFCSVLSFSAFIRAEAMERPGAAGISLGCSKEDFLVMEREDGSLACANTSSAGSAGGNTFFVVRDLNSTFARKAAGTPDDISLSDSLYDGIFTKLFTSNIFESLVDGNYPAVIVFATAFAVALTRVRRDVGNFGHVFVMLKELDMIFMYILEFVVSLTPVAVVSLIMKAFGSQDSSSETFSRVAFLVAATLLAMALHVSFAHVGLFVLVRRTNPMLFFRHMVPAQMMAFACASSAATMPVTIKCVISSGFVPRPIVHLVVPLGATINMDGTAIFFPCACIWLACINGLQFDAAACLTLGVISVAGSVGTAPVPHASLALILTAYNTVFGQSGTPAGFDLLIGVDWLLNRFRTVLNVTGDGVVSSVVGHMCPLQSDDAGAPLQTHVQAASEMDAATPPMRPPTQ